MKNLVTICAAVFLFCTSLYARTSASGDDECTACQMMKMIRPGSPFFELAKSMHQQNPKSTLDQHWFCDFFWYYNGNASNFLKWEQLPSSKWAIRFTPASYCTVWSTNIYFNTLKNSPANKKDTLDIFILEATSPYNQIYKTFYLANPFNQDYKFPLYPPLGGQYSSGYPFINPRRDFLLAFKMRGPTNDSVQWYFKTPAADPNRSLKFLTNTSVQTASVALGQSVDIENETELCLHIPFGPGFPVELSLFSAQTFSQGVRLSWETATETNNYGFQLMRANSKDGPWEKREFIPGKGYSTTKQQYNCNDALDIPSLLQKGQDVIWYKIVQIDNDGSLNDYSPIMVQLFNGTPEQFELEQNFPNPISAGSNAGMTTTIRYRMPYAHHVTLTIYDALGREVQQLVDEMKPPGIHQVMWNAKELPAGIYMIKLDAGLNSMMKKMLLVR